MRWLTAIAALAVPLAAGGCGLDFYGAEEKAERAIYCYQAMVGIDCYTAPNHQDERRLIAYTGPAPETYPRPAPPPEPRLYAPEMISYYVKDPEPVPTSPPKARAVSRETLPPVRRK